MSTDTTTDSTTSPDVTASENRAGGGQRPVLVIQHYALPRDQGGGTRAIDLFGRLKKWTPTIIASNFGHTSRQTFKTSDERFALVPVPQYNSNGVARMAGWGVFAAEAFGVGLTKRADVVFGSSPHMLAPVAALALARIKRVPFVLEIRDLWPESIVTAGELEAGSALHRALVALETLLYKQAAKIVVVTGGWEDHIAALGADPGKVVVIPNGTEVSDFQVSESKAQLRERWGISGYTAVFTGAHGPYVGLHLILDAAEKLPDVNFLLVGAGPRKAEAVADAERRGLTNVEFRDPVAKNDLPSLLAACDVGLHTVTPQPVFDKGMSPNKLFDYLASGLPVVTNAKVPLRRVIVDDQCGAVVEPDGLAEGIQRVRAADQATLERWHDNAMELMVSRFSRSSAAQTLEQVLDEVAAR